LSSILTALKKLENNSYHNQELLVLSKRGLSRQKNTSWTFQGISRFSLKTLFVVSLVLFSLAMVLRFRSQGDSKDRAAAVQPEVGKPALIKTSDDPMENGSLELDGTGTGVKNLSKAYHEPPPSENRLPREPDTSADSDRETPAMNPDPSLDKPPGPMNEPKTKDLFETTLKKETTRPLAGHPGWTLQAIAWAPDPKKRIAVINGSVLKEGTAFEGALVSRIDENEVTLLKGEDVFRLVINLR